MNRPRHRATLVLVAAFAAIQLLATAPLLHPYCNPLGLLAQSSKAPAIQTPDGAVGRAADECPICMVSGLAAVLAPRLALFAPAVLSDGPLRPVPFDVPQPAGHSAESRGPPTV